MAERSTITVYTGRNSPEPVDIFKADGSPYNFVDLQTTKVGVEIAGQEYLSTDGYLSFSGNTLTFMLGKVENPPKGKRLGRIIRYSSQYPDGRPIFSEKTEYQFMFEFV